MKSQNSIPTNYYFFINQDNKKNKLEINRFQFIYIVIKLKVLELLISASGRIGSLCVCVFYGGGSLKMNNWFFIGGHHQRTSKPNPITTTKRGGKKTFKELPKPKPHPLVAISDGSFPAKDLVT